MAQLELNKKLSLNNNEINLFARQLILNAISQPEPTPQPELTMVNLLYKEKCELEDNTSCGFADDI